MTQAEAGIRGTKAVRLLGCLVYELIRGQAPSLRANERPSPLPLLNEVGNLALRKAFGSTGEDTPFRNCEEFWRVFKESISDRSPLGPSPAKPEVDKLPVEIPKGVYPLPSKPTELEPEKLPPSSSGGSGGKSPSKQVIAVLTIAAVLVVGGLIYLAFKASQSPLHQSTPIAAVASRPLATATPSVEAPAESGSKLSIRSNAAVGVEAPAESSGKLLVKFQGHTNGVTSAVFSPDVRRVLTASDDNTARLWGAESGKLLVTFQGHTNGVWSAVFSPDVRRVLTASSDKTARLWEAESGKLLVTFQGHTDDVWSAVEGGSVQKNSVSRSKSDDNAHAFHLGTTTRCPPRCFQPLNRRKFTLNA